MPTASRAARPAAPRSSSDRSRSAPACSTIGMPGDPHGIADWMPTIADVLKTAGLRHRPVRQEPSRRPDEHLPTKHGFDEFFGNLYHLNAEEEPEGYFYPKDPDFRKKFGPRGVHQDLVATARSRTPARSPPSACRRSTRSSWPPPRTSSTGRRKANKPFFCWFNSTRMHVFTHLKPESLGKTGKGIHADGMVEHDGHVGAAAEAARRPRHRRQHHRALHDRQRRGDRAVAGRRHDDCSTARRARPGKAASAFR